MKDAGFRALLALGFLGLERPGWCRVPLRQSLHLLCDMADDMQDATDAAKA